MILMEFADDRYKPETLKYFPIGSKAKKGAVLIPGQPDNIIIKALDDGSYMVLSNETDNDESDENNQGVRQILRRMDPDTGDIRNKSGTSEGRQMYGHNGYVIDDQSRIILLKSGKYIISDSGNVSEMTDRAVFSWDGGSGARYPKGKDLVHGIILIHTDDTVTVGRFGKNERCAPIDTIGVYNHKMELQEEKKLNIPMKMK